MIEIRRATAKDVESWYDGPPAYTMKGYVIVEDESILAICGVFWCEGKKYIFSEMKEQMVRYRRAIIKAARKVMADVEGETVYAVATEGIESAPRFIEHYGFECIDPATKLYRRH